MKTYLYIIVVAAIVLGVLSGIGWAASPATVPQSSIRSGLIRSPNPVDTSSNLVITGNVGGGRHFRGVVPYYAPSTFSGALGSSTLDSFLRDSAGSEDIGQFSGRTIPYYSQTGTVTTTTPGRLGIVRPPAASPGIDALSPEAGRVLPPLPGTQVMPGRESSISLRYVGPLSTKLLEPRQVTSPDADLYMQQQTLTAQQWFWARRFRQQLEQEQEKAIEPVGKLPPQQAEKLDKGVLRQVEPQAPAKQPHQEKLPDIYEQMKQRIYELQKSSQEPPAAEQLKKSDEKQRKPPADQTTEDSQKKTSAVDELLSGDVSTRARTILGQYKSLAAFSNDKFNQNMRDGELYLKQGKYYRAADAYTLALIYKPADPLAYAGKSLALFAAGEYMSSALFLSRAMELFPEYASLDIDIVALTGDRDILETRAADVGEWLKKGDVVELQFLLAYVYYRLGRLEEARTAINAAYEKMPDAPAVIALQKAIESGL